MKLSVTSEIGRLRRVLVHLPGREIDVMMPSMMEDLLFDDILYGQVAREEHRKFQQIIRFVADEVHDFQDLLEETLEQEEARREILADMKVRESLSRKTVAMLKEEPPASLAEMLIGGIEAPRAQKSEAHAFELSPLPNLFFMRDPQVILSDGVMISAMATEARRRESLLSRFVFAYHPAFQGRDLFWMDESDEPWPKGASASKRKPRIEGGDILVARRDLLLIGLTERTNRAGILRLAQSLRNGKSDVKTIIVIDIPNRRSYMHLDTVFTIINRHECLAHAPVILEGGPEEADVYEIDLGKRPAFRQVGPLLRTLKKRGLDLEPIVCGGANPIDQQREQWTDGANAFTLAPGIILGYERNVRTAEQLARRGYHLIYEDDLLLGRTELETWTDKKYAIQVSGYELSRARGGPRCMTMPLEREELAS
jgi:arginine deiminase